MRVVQDTLAPTGLTGTLTDRVRDLLRRDIVSGRLAPGSRLKISDLTARYQISGAPIREALGQLQGEGLVVLWPNRGASVRAVDEDFIRHIYEVREAIEAFLVARFAEKATREDIAALEAIQARLEEAGRERNNLAIQAANQSFHAQINAAHCNPEALEILRRSSQLVAHLRHQFGYSDTRLAQITAEHHAILSALQRRDPASAAAAVAEHDRSACAELVRQLAQARERNPLVSSAHEEIRFAG